VTWTLPEPMLSSPVPEPRLRPGWAAELKWDGFRDGTGMAASFPEIVAGAA
jgi:ATP-dependent DNA ligase